MVGHYENDAIASVESILDQCLEGRLSERFMMGVYAGRLPSTEFVLSEHTQPNGAIIVGLGEAGHLDQQQLQNAYMHAFVYYATQQTGHDVSRIATLLIGVQSLPLDSVLTALLQAWMQSHTLFKQTRPHALTQLEIIEIDAFRALECSDILYRWQESEAYQNKFTILESLEALPDDVVLAAKQKSRWWQPLFLPEHLTSNPPELDELPRPIARQMKRAQTACLQLSSNNAIYDWEQTNVDHQAWGLQTALVRQFSDMPTVRLPATPQRIEQLWIGENWLEPHEHLSQTKVADRNPESVFCALYQQPIHSLHWQGQATIVKGELGLQLQDITVTLADFQQLQQMPQGLVLMLNNTMDGVLLVTWVKALLELGVKTIVVNRYGQKPILQKAFCQAFYQYLLTGDSWGMAAFKARQDLAQQGKAWQGFDVYGHPELYWVSKP